MLNIRLCCPVTDLQAWETFLEEHSNDRQKNLLKMNQHWTSLTWAWNVRNRNFALHWKISTLISTLQKRQKIPSKFQSQSYPQTRTQRTVSFRISSSRTRKIIQELVDSEKKYIKNLSQGIRDYLVPYDTKELPSSLAGKRFEIFSNIEVIQEIHEKLFMRKILDCNYDPLCVANVFLEMVENKYFDNYIIYVQFRIHPDEIIRENIEYFETLQLRVSDNLGISSFLSQPIQRLPRYQLLLAELITDLMQDLDNNKEAITGCCLAEKEIQRLLKVVDTHCW